MATIALEFVPPSAEGGPAKAREEAGKVRDLLRKAGIAERVDTLLVPGMIAEESDRPVPLEEKMDPLDVRRATREALPLQCVVTQVTAFSSMDALAERLDTLAEADIHRVVFVGVPRTLADGQGPGVAPTEALSHFRDRVPHRGVILIPT
ncbi:MAG: mycobacterial-type methylenetetrahydrofolate reductase, partial [Myxococcota bacterium]|nr:mycobacterial-type methylenetetrahydrofolate reductase [Myxococcota bacterium]